ncbi:MAG: hypothetical protein ACERKV_10755 [Clostridiaceae bacterium]
MKKFQIIGLTLVLTLGTTAAVFANNYSSTNGEGNSLGRGMKGTFSGISTYIQDKLGLTDDEIADMGNERGALDDYLIEQGYTQDEIEALEDEAKTAKIDEALTNGDITEDQATEIKEHIANDVAYEREGFGEMGANGNQNMGPNNGSNGMGYSIMANTETYLQEELGLTDDEIAEIGTDRGALHEYLLNNGYTEEDIQTLMEQAKTASIDEAIANGDITEDQAAEIKDNIANGVQGGKGQIASNGRGRNMNNNCAPYETTAE